jgi:hypothetical protein
VSTPQTNDRPHERAAAIRAADATKP